MLRPAYNYMFYKLYQWSIRLNGDDDFHTYYASGMLTVLCTINVFTILMAVDVTTGGSVEISRPPKLFWIAATLLLFISNYLYFRQGGRYLRILAHYGNQSRLKARRGNVFVATFVIGSFVLLIGVGLLGLIIG